MGNLWPSPAQVRTLTGTRGADAQGYTQLVNKADADILGRSPAPSTLSSVVSALSTGPDAELAHMRLLPYQGELGCGPKGTDTVAQVKKAKHFPNCPGGLWMRPGLSILELPQPKSTCSSSVHCQLLPGRCLWPSKGSLRAAEVPH